MNTKGTGHRFIQKAGIDRLASSLDDTETAVILLSHDDLTDVLTVLSRSAQHRITDPQRLFQQMVGVTAENQVDTRNPFCHQPVGRQPEVG